MRKKCYVYKCENKTSFQRIRTYCHIHNIPHKSNYLNVITYIQLSMNMSNAEECIMYEKKDDLGNTIYLKK